MNATYTLGTVVAVALCYSKHKSIIGCLVAGWLSWLYVAGYVVNSMISGDQPRAYASASAPTVAEMEVMAQSGRSQSKPLSWLLLIFAVTLVASLLALVLWQSHEVFAA